MSLRRCPCGTPLPVDARFCHICCRTFVEAPVTEPAPRSHESPRRTGAPLPARGDFRWSRTAAGPMSFGLRGRIVLTALTVAVPFFVFWYSWLFGLALIFMWVLFAMPILLRDIWKRERVLTPEQQR